MKLKVFAMATMLATSMAGLAQNTPASQMEKLDRGLIAVKTSSGNFVSWRLFGTDNDNTTFKVLRNGTSVYSATTKTSFQDTAGNTSSKYQVVTIQDGEPVDTSDVVTPWTNSYLQVKLNRPAGGSNEDGNYTYSPNDCSVGDVDGDGQYEIIVKWDPSNSKDNSHSGRTGNVYLDCYEFDGTQRWRVDLGLNIRAGAHYTQYLVYDFDKDGKSELICKTAPGSIDGAGIYVNQAATDEKIKGHDNTKVFRNSSGHVMSGAEYLTVFNGETGKAMHTIWYNPNRAGNMNSVGAHPSSSDFWGDNYGNRAERYLACVAYLDGPDAKPSAIMQKGYYTRAYVWAVDWDGTALKTKWLHASVSTTKVELYDADMKKTSKIYTKNTRPNNSGSKTAHSNGNHNISVADVDGDGCDEIIHGSCAIDNDGNLLYATGFGHGDAIHLGDHVPDRPGLELFQIHESSPYGWDLHDAATGELLHSATGSGDNGRGICGNFDANVRGSIFWSSNDGSARSAVTGSAISSKHGSSNFRIYWDGDLTEDLLDGNKIDKWNGNGTSRLLTASGSSCNGSKSTPNLSADIFGDWREELIVWDGNTSAILNVYTSTVATEFRVPTLMHDHTYRMGVAWQNCAYNQPPHLGYYLPDMFKTEFIAVEGDFIQKVSLGDSIVPLVAIWKNCAAPSIVKSIAPDGTETTGGAMSGFTFKIDKYQKKEITLTGKPEQLGEYQFIFKSGANVADNSIKQDTIRVICMDPTGIENVENAYSNTIEAVYTVGGMKTNKPTEGISIIKYTDGRKKKVIK